jgi:putative ABC transport system permease protein
MLAERAAPVLEQAPLVSARIARVGGRSAGEWLREDAEISRDLRWALRREYRLTYSSALRETEEVVAGKWWSDLPVPGPAPDGTPAPVSLEADLAETLGVGVGDTMEWDVQGVAIPSVVTSVREVDWGRMATNFFVIFPPGVLEEAPGSHVLLLRIEDTEDRAILQRDLVARFPNVSALDATTILQALDAVLAQAGRAVRALSALTLSTGFLILLAAAAASRHERTREALLLRTLGADGRLVRRVVATEAIALSALAAVVGTATAIAASAGLVVGLFEIPYRPPWLDLALLTSVAFVVSAGLGWWHGRPATRGSPLAGLRAEEMG